jgi:23S rRNA (cytidine1920-2'-O)/16S rRNA (cytidine1409-2'-O)-methyltransferase
MTMERIDQLLVKLNKAETRSKARAMILAGEVFINDMKINKAGVMVDENQKIEVKSISSKYVSRGGFKLEAAVKHFKISLEGLTALDAGASTGGFTDCLLQNGAFKVFAIDVGYGQLAYRLQIDPRVVPFHRTNVRYLTLDDIKTQVDIITADLSFISLKKVLLSLKEILKNEGFLLTLIKPQFEAGQEFIQKGGVVKDPKIHRKVLIEMVEYSESIKLDVKGIFPSPLLGPSGNREFFLLMKKDYNYNFEGLMINKKIEKLLLDME